MNIIKMIFAPLVYAYILISSSPFVFFLPLLNLVHLCMACTLSYVYGEGVLREGILGSSAQFVWAVGEKLFSGKMFSKLGCLREVVLEKPFGAKPFYASQPEVVLEEVVLQEEVLRAPTPKALLLLSPHVLRTDHADWVRLGTDGHN